jgi:hypothetical protein
MHFEKFSLLGPSQNGKFFQIEVTPVKTHRYHDKRIFTLKQRSYSQAIIEGYAKDHQ